MKKLIICLLIFSLLLQVGCTSSSYINADEYSDEYKSDLTRVILKDSTEYELGRVYNIKNDTLFIYYYENYLEQSSSQKKIPLNDISIYIYDSADIGRTLLFVIVGTGAMLALIVFLSISVNGIF